jgi:hypothetical protein
MAVDRIACGKARMVNERFNAMTSDYLREATFFNPASGWESVQMEKNVQDTRRRLWQGVPVFASLADLNEWLEQRCLALWHEVRNPEDKTRMSAQAARCTIGVTIWLFFWETPLPYTTAHRLPGCTMP